MNTLLAEVIDAHGGLDRWNALTTVRATIVSGGDMFVIKGMPYEVPSNVSVVRSLRTRQNARPASLWPRPHRFAGLAVVAVIS
ncbi:hypothetical protein ACFCX0_38935 [Streptomyces sp. NPDC056352]|uniref:hypothetical protein n=1 Tax=Streptomyces sp. NPDC056352 TaxID=3345791 RepID=UPI0035D53FA1